MEGKDAEDQTTILKVLLNPLIVDRLFKFLPNDDLLSFRLVNKLWDEEAFRKLKKRFTGSPDSDKNTTEFITSEQVERFKTTFENDQSKILKQHQHKYIFSTLAIESALKPKPLFDFIRTFKEIKGIRINGGHIAYSCLLEILRKCQHLEEFEMKSWFHGAINFATATSNATGIGFELPCLKKLDLEMFYRNLPLFPGPLEEFGKFEKKMVESAQNLSSIRLAVSELHKIVRGIENFNFSALNEISICQLGDVTGFTILPVQLKVLKVEIGFMNNCSTELVSLLQAQSKSLQILKINISGSFDTIQPINFSTSDHGLQMEKLKELHLTISDQKQLRIGPIYYSRTFPVLEELHVQFEFLVEESFRGLLRRSLETELFLKSQDPSKSVTKISITSPPHRNLVRPRISPIVYKIFVNLKVLDLELNTSSYPNVGGIEIPFRFM